MKFHKQLLLIVSLMVLLLPACSPTTPPPLTATAIPTPTPTSTPFPTPSPEDLSTDGDALLRQSDFGGALAAYQKAITTDADYGPAHAGLAQVYLWQAVDYDEALAQAQKAVALAPENMLAHATLAQAQLAHSAPAEAMEAAEQAVDLEPESAFAQSILALAYLMDHQYDSAREAVAQAVTLDPELPEVYYALGRFYRETADFARAHAAYEQAVALEPEFVLWQNALGYLWLQEERYEEAITTFEAVLDIAPDYLPALLGQARISMEQLDYEAAETQLEHVTELYPTSGSVDVEWAYFYIAQEKYDEALEKLQAASAHKSLEQESQRISGYIYFRQDECDQAERQFQDLSAANPRFAAPQIGLGYAKLCQQNESKALEYFRKAVELDPYNVEAQLGMGGAYAQQGRWDDASKSCVEALRLSIAPSEAHRSLGALFTVQQMFDLAEEEYRLALALNPYLQEAYVGLGEALLTQGNIAQAQQMAEEAMALDEENPAARQLLGIANVVNHDMEKGAEILEQVLEDEPDEVVAYYYLGVAHLDLGKYRQAKQDLETFQALAGGDAAQDSHLNYLLATLEQGYSLSDERAIENLQEFAELMLNDVPEIRVEEQEEAGRTLIITQDAGPGDLDQSVLLGETGFLAGISAMVIPQIDPPVPNGLLIEINQWGRTVITACATLADLKDYGYGLSSPEEFGGSLDISFSLTSERTSLAEIESLVSEMRELELDAPASFEINTREELHDRLSQGVDSQPSETSENMEDDEALLVLLGAIEPETDLEKLMVDLYTEQVSGFYDIEEKTLYLLESEEQTALDQIIIAHEYVHALQDYNFGLAPLNDSRSSNDDRQLAFRALIEGDATLSMLLYADENIPLVDMLQVTSDAGGLEQETLDSSPVFIRQISTFPYQSGLEFVAALYQRGGWDEVNEAYAHPPKSTEQILHPERYWEDDTPQTVSITTLDNSWRVLDENTLGELGLQLVLDSHVGPAVAMQATEGWGGDRYLLLQNRNTDAYALAMRISWDDQDEADEFWDLYQTTMRHWLDYTEDVQELTGEVQEHWWISESGCVFATRQDGDIILVFGPDRESVAQLVESLS